MINFETVKCLTAERYQPPAKKGGRQVSAAKRKKAAKCKTARISKISISGRKENGVELKGYAHYYYNKDFHALSPDTRSAILKARKDNNYVPGQNNDQGNSDRNASQVYAIQCWFLSILVGMYI